MAWISAPLTIVLEDRRVYVDSLRGNATNLLIAVHPPAADSPDRQRVSRPSSSQLNQCSAHKPFVDHALASHSQLGTGQTSVGWARGQRRASQRWRPRRKRGIGATRIVPLATPQLPRCSQPIMTARLRNTFVDGPDLTRATRCNPRPLWQTPRRKRRTPLLPGSPAFPAAQTPRRPSPTQSPRPRRSRPASARRAPASEFSSPGPVASTAQGPTSSPSVPTGSGPSVQAARSPADPEPY